MKKWFPYFIGLLIPIMIFISFTWMVKKRILIFKDEFVKQGIETLEKTQTQFIDLLKQDVFHRFNEIELKLVSLKEEDDDTESQRKVGSFLKDQISDARIIDNIFITDENLNFKYFYAPLPEDRARDFKWAVQNQDAKGWTKFFVLKGSYIAYKDFQDMKIFISINPQFFYQKLKEEYPFLKEDLQVTQKNLFLNFSSSQYTNNKVVLLQAENVLESEKKYTIEIEGDYYIFCKKTILTQDQERVWDFNFFFRIKPSEVPLNLWHKIILMITAVLIVLMFIVLLIKMKNEADNNEILLYEKDLSGQEFWNKSFISEEEKSSMDNEQALDTALEESEDFTQIPDEYFNQSKDAPATELSHIIDEVKGHEDEINKYNTLWKKILQITPENSKLALSFLDSDLGAFTPQFKTGFSSEDSVELNLHQWLIKEYLLNGKSLLINSDAMAATPLKEIFSAEDYADIDSVFVVPFQKSNTPDAYDGIFIMACETNIAFDVVQEIKSLIFKV